MFSAGRNRRLQARWLLYAESLEVLESHVDSAARDAQAWACVMVVSSDPIVHTAVKIL